MILKKELILISMAKNSLNKVGDHLVIVAHNSISHMLISKMLTIYSKNSLVVKILLPTSLMMMMISLVEVSDIVLEGE